MTAVLDAPATPALTPRPHQVRGIAGIERVFTTSPRAQLHWACGTGKTLTVRWYAQKSNAQVVVVYAPSLALLAQLLAEWQAAGGWAFDPLIVCSDPTTADPWQVDGEFWTAHHAQVTTNAADVTRFLVNRRPGRARIVFSTYHSAPIVARAQKKCRVVFDLAVADEAHCLAGDPDPRFRVVMDDTRTYATRRLYCTATPVIARTDSGAPWDTLSMDDVAQFGPVADRLDIPTAVAAGLLVDYQVVVLNADEPTGGLSGQQQVPAALVAAARRGLSRVISFHSRVESARAFTDAVDRLTLPDGRTVRAITVAGSDPIAVRRAALAELANPRPDRLVIVANARCLGVGIDVPAVDGVIFADPKQSATDIVQAIGRAQRPAAGKTLGTIILPVTLPDGADDDLMLSNGPLAVVYGVLRALRAVDSRMATEVDRLYRPPRAARSDGDGHHAARLLEFNLPAGLDLTQLATRVVTLDGYATGGVWDRMLEELRSYANKHRHTTPPPATPLGGWVTVQRCTYSAGALQPDRITRLEAVPHWGWTADSARWALDHAAVLAVADRHGGVLRLDQADVSGAPLVSRTGGKTCRKRVGRWCAEQRIARRTGLLSDRRAALCEDIPGWSWTGGLDKADIRMVDRLAAWVDEHRTAADVDPAAPNCRDLGEWAEDLRVRSAAGTVPPALADEIAAVTPSVKARGFQWRRAETAWKLQLAALRQFIDRTGGIDLPERHVETVHGVPVRLTDWAGRTRYQARHGDLDPGKRAELAAIPAWQWEKTRRGRARLAAGDERHGTHRGYIVGCTCEPCATANAVYEAGRRAAAAAGQPTASRVDPAKARGHMRMLEGQCGWRARPAMQRITGLNQKTIGAISNGERVGGIMPEVEALILALTVDRIRAWLAAHPSPRDPFPAAPTLALIDQMHHRLGWPKAWLVRELGMGQSALQVGRAQDGGPGDTVRRSTRDGVQALWDRLDGRRCPGLLYRAQLPALADIIAAEATPEGVAS